VEGRPNGEKANPASVTTSFKQLRCNQNSSADRKRGLVCREGIALVKRCCSLWGGVEGEGSYIAENRA